MIINIRKGETVMNIVDKITKQQINPNIPDFRVGDTVKVGVTITELKVNKKDKKTEKSERIQAFEGIVIGRNGSGIHETFTVRKISNGVGVERIFPVHSPKLADITVVRKGKVRRAKLNFLKDLVSQVRIKERG
jgi:large subunit ribosomal protein L19